MVAMDTYAGQATAHRSAEGSRPRGHSQSQRNRNWPARVIGGVRILLAVALALVLAGCANAGRVAAGHGTVGPPAASRRPAVVQAPDHGVSARVVLPSAVMPAGSRMTGHVLVSNSSGHAIRVFGCLNLFQVLLTSSTYRPAAAWAACLQRFTIPVGVTRYPVTVWASYNQCSRGHSRDGLRACLPGGRMPPLPPGTYHARLFQVHQLVQVPSPVSVRVAPAHS
jgi:hypothetical protein